MVVKLKEIQEEQVDTFGGSTVEVVKKEEIQEEQVQLEEGN